MAEYKLDSSLDANKVFLAKRSELENKFEVSYYIPEISKLDRIVRKKSQKKLKDFICNISSGATPSISNEDKFYSNKENGVPFLRVQNLQVNGKLNIEDVKYINEKTHNTFLKRNKVKSGDLLVKITGVGRMAIASVAPDGFEGNTNQHMVVIKTENKKISEYLSKYLNLDFVEKLASRRSTGGTRPALDYPALKSIPIIENIDFSILEISEKEKQQKENEAKTLLESIDNYLLGELGITLPEKDNSLEARIYTTTFSEVCGGRLDANYNSKINYLITQKANYKFEELKSFLLKNPQYGANEEAIEITSEDDIRYIRITDIDDIGELKIDKTKTANKTDDRYLLNFNDILFARSGSVGKCYIHKNTNNLAIFAGYLIRFIVNNRFLNPNFLFYYCNSSIYKFWISAIERPAVQSNINSEEFKKMPIPLPPIEKQNEIVEHIQEIRTKAKQLQKEAVQVLEQAKQQIEQIILGN